MKKIIYSFVIMIAAGSLFTSCVTNTEPQGVKDLREAKADYLASLSKLREADAEKVKAEAALVQAQTATEQALAALKQALAKEQEIKNDKNAADNAIALEKALKDAEVYLAQQELALATAEENLRAYLVKVEEQSKQLTAAEYQIVVAYTVAYNNVVDKQKAVRDKEKALYEATYSKKGQQNVEAAKAGYEQEKALAEQSKAYYEAVLAANKELSDAEIADYSLWVKAYDALKDENTAFLYEKAQIVKDSTLNEYENKAALDSFYAKVDAKADAIAKVSGVFNFKKFKSDLPVVSFTEGSVVETFIGYADDIDSVSFSADHKKMEVAASKSKDAVKNVVDSLNLIIDALNREGVVVDQIVKDTTGIAALVAKTQHDYDSIKAVLEAGIDKFGGLADKQKAYDDAVKEADAQQKKFVADTAKLTAKIKEFEQIWKKREGEIKGDDSTVIWNAFIDVMKARAEVFPNDPAYYYFATPVLKGQHPVWEKDSVLFQNLEFAGIQNDEGYVKYGHWLEPGHCSNDDAFGRVLNKGLNQLDYTFHFYYRIYWPLEGSLTDKDNYNKLISFGGKYRFNSAGKIWSDGVGAYVPKYVADAVAKVSEAEQAITKAKEDYYKGIYCTFWGLEKVGSIAETGIDSLKINFTEKTYTDPKVLVTFSGEDFFTPAKDKKAAEITWGNVNYNDTSVALKAIETQLGQNNIKINENEGTDYTLYAKTLAVAQFATGAVNYKENTKALAELNTIVKAVETAYNDAVSAASAGSAKADSLMIALTGKKDGTIVDHNITEGFINVDGSFDLAGEQKTLAEEWIAEYAKTYSELEAQKAEVDVTIGDNNKLAQIYEDYVKKLAALDDYTGATPDAILTSVKTAWNNVLNSIKTNIATQADNIKIAEAKLAKLEAGYDQSQIDIEAAEDALAKAKAALEQAKLEFALAEEAYKAVLAAHGITE